MKNYQYGGGKCKLCGCPNVNKATCPLNPDAKHPNPKKHPKAENIKLKKIISLKTLLLTEIAKGRSEHAQTFLKSLSETELDELSKIVQDGNPDLLAIVEIEKMYRKPGFKALTVE